jgi:D-alanyl-D-alanine carboxypeptidase (penicillin-binding protein 5/6)
MTTTLQPRHARTPPYGPRRGRVLLGAVLAALLLAATAFVAAGHVSDDKDRAYLSTDGWPRTGQGAYVLGNGRLAVSPDQQPVPIASLAKVMTAYLVVTHHPLGGTDSGRRFVVGQRDVEDTETRRRADQSVVEVRAGEQLTERDALMAILLPSANNIAVLVARQVAGSVASFVEQMNDTAQALGMSDTTYTDPSGFDERTVSTALDQLRLARVVAENPMLAAMMATRSYPLPVAGDVTNTNTLLGQDGFVGMKTGSHDAAGGCFMFRSWRHTGSGNVPLTGVVLGQQGHNLITAGLYAAKQLADHVAPIPATPDLRFSQERRRWLRTQIGRPGHPRSTEFSGGARLGQRRPASADQDPAVMTGEAVPGIVDLDLPAAGAGLPGQGGPAPAGSQVAAQRSGR